MAESEAFGIPRLLELLANAIQTSEQLAVEHGTTYVEFEGRWCRAIRGTARQFGGDVTDAQWYAGAATVLSALVTHESVNPLAQLLGINNDALGQISTCLGRIHDDVVKEGVVVFDGIG